ncbi:hypothetical protein IV454_16405 [Massilia antarctica]|uniref:Bacteriophage tail tape measure N-terminal domain-containing protein n=1 Tax=Massilia antarctica TaxID=2765360 RepID=A0AA48WII1_9BURK|nr:hypothetical protein [Massilia antarctica]QPI52928.1 hypothetical protein IV454_16405 [Massilia antarctica]
MSEITNTATIKVVADTSEVEVGMRKIDDAAAKTGRNLDNLGKGDSAFAKIGAGGDAAAARVQAASKSLADAVASTQAAMAEGSKASAAYYASLAKSNAPQDSVKPFLAQIEALTAAEKVRAETFATGLEQTRSLFDVASAAATSAQQKLGGLKLDAEQLTVPDSAIESINNWKEAVAYAAGTAFGAAVVAAKAGFEALTDYIKVRLALRAAAAVAGVAAEVVGAIYLAYKSIDFAVGLLTGESYKSANIDALVAANKEMVDLQKNFRLSATEASGLVAALASLGVSKGDYVDTFREAGTAIKENADELDALGVKYKDAAGNLLPMRDVLSNVQAELAKYTSGLERNAVASALGFGSSEKIDAALSVTAEKLAAVTERQREYGLLIGGAQQAELARYASVMAEFHSELDNTSQGFKRAIADNIMPALTNLADFFKEGWPSVVQAFRGALAGFTTLFYGLKTVVDIVVESVKAALGLLPNAFEGVVKVFGNLIKGDFSAAAASLVETWDNAIGLFSKAGDKMVDYARANVAAIKMAWGQKIFPDEVQLKAPTLKSAKEATDTIKKSADITAQVEEYKKLSAATAEHIALLQAEVAGGAKLTEGQKQLITFQKSLADGKVSLNDEIKKQRVSELEAQIAVEKAIEKNAEGQKLSVAAAAASSAAAEKEASEYANLIASITAKTEAIKLELLTGQNATEGQKASIKLEQELTSGKRQLSAATLAVVRAKLEELAAAEKLQKIQAAEKGAAEYVKENTLARQASAASLASEYALYGKGTDARDLAAVGLRNEAELQKKLADMQKANLPVTQQMIDQMTASAKARTLEEQATLAQTKALAYATQLGEENKKFAAENLADPRARADALLKIDADMWQKRIALAAEGTEARKIIEGEYDTWYANQKKKMVLDVDTTKANELLNTMSAFDDLAKDAASRMAESFGKVGKAIGGMTTALSGFGKAQAAIAAQKANAISQSFGDPKKIQDATDRAASASARSRLQEYGQLTDAASGFFGEQSKGYAALQAASKVFHAAELAMTLAELVPKGVSAVLTQGKGDPWSAFARMAAMAAIVTGLGVAISGGMGSAGGAKAADVQKAQGTGTVLGDADAKSDSIHNSLELIGKNTYQGLAYSAGMLASLRNIELSMTGLNKLITRTPGVTDGKSFGIQTGQLNIGKPTDAVSKVMTEVTKGLFGPGLGDKIASFINNVWGKTTRNIVDSGIKFGGSVNDLQAGKGYDQYASVDTTKSSFFGLSKKTTNSVQAAGLSDELSAQFGMVFTGLEETLRSAAVGLGLNADDVSKKLDGLVIATTTLSLKDLKGDELTSALNAVISKTMDQISEAAFPSFEQFRKIGEGYGETVIRVAQDFQVIDVVMASFGRVFGAVGVGSVAARERLIEMTGGLEAFTKGAEFFSQNYLSEAERNEALAKRINAAFAELGVSGIATRDQFRQVVLGLDLTTEKGAKTYAGLMGVQEAFAQLNPAIEEVSQKVRSLAEIKIEGADLQDQIDALKMKPDDYAEKQRLAARGKIDVSNQPKFDELTGARAAAALAAVNKTYEDQIAGFVRATMSASEIRALETKGMDATTIKLYDLVAAYNASAVASGIAKEAADRLASTNKGYQDKIDEFAKAGLSAAALRTLETKDMDKSTIALYDKLKALEAEKVAADKAAQDERDRNAQQLRDNQEYARAQEQLAADARRAAEQMRNAWQSVTDSIFDEVKRIRGLAAGGGAATLAGVQAEFATRTAQAQSGNQDAAKLLPSISQKLIELAEANATSLIDLQRIRARTAASLDATGAILSAKFGLTLPSLAVGTNYLPSDMVIQAHEGERVIPAADNRALMQMINRPAPADSSNAARQQASDEIAGLRAEVRSIAFSNAALVGMFKRVIKDDKLQTEDA